MANGRDRLCQRVRLVGGKLTARQLETLTAPGRYGDGAGLWLHIGRTGGKAWVLRYQFGGRAREMGLGAVDPVLLAAAVVTFDLPRLVRRAELSTACLSRRTRRARTRPSSANRQCRWSSTLSAATRA